MFDEDGLFDEVGHVDGMDDEVCTVVGLMLEEINEEEGFVLSGSRSVGFVSLLLLSCDSNTPAVTDAAITNTIITA